MPSPAPRRSRPASVQGTPQAARQNVPSSSPLFFQSSPAAPNGNANGNAKMEISSPLKQVSVAGSTPRAPPGGKLRTCKRPQLLISQIHLQSATHHRPVPHELPPTVTDKLIYPQAAAVCLFDLRDHLHPAPLVSTTRGEETSIPTSSVQPLAAAADSSLTRMAYPSEMGFPLIRLPSPTLTPTHQKLMPLEAHLRESFGGRTSLSRIRCLHLRNSFWAIRKSIACGPTVLQRKRLPSLGVEAMRGSMLRC